MIYAAPTVSIIRLIIGCKRSPKSDKWLTQVTKQCPTSSGSCSYFSSSFRNKLQRYFDVCKIKQLKNIVLIMACNQDGLHLVKNNEDILWIILLMACDKNCKLKSSICNAQLIHFLEKSTLVYSKGRPVHLYLSI